MNLVHVAVLDGDVRLRVVPHALDVDVAALGLDLINEVVAHSTAGRVGEGVSTLLGDAVGFHLVAFAVEALGEVETSAGADAVVGPFADEAFERGTITGALVFAVGFVVAEIDTGKVGVDEGALVFVVLVETQQVLMQLQRFDEAVIFVGGFDVPREELGGGIEDGAGGFQLKGVLRLGAGLFAGGVKGERVVGEEVVHGGPEAVRCGALV